MVCLLLSAGVTNAQQKASFDLAAIRNMKVKLNGMNVSGFYHFNKTITAGLEVNRFFPKNKIVDGEEIEQSAWDLDLNVHFLIPFTKEFKFYPITGISHTSEKEYLKAINESIYDRFWSFNAGAGVLFEMGRWSPHAEYLFTWGHLHQQFFLVGISYELELGKEKEKK